MLDQGSNSKHTKNPTTQALEKTPIKILIKIKLIFALSQCNA